MNNRSLQPELMRLAIDGRPESICVVRAPGSSLLGDSEATTITAVHSHAQGASLSIDGQPGQ
jgi:hypothetical protein